MAILIHVSTIIADASGNVLFVREAKQIHRGLWNLPGGHVEIGEELTHAAIREVKEETGLDASLTGLLGIYTGISAELHSIRHVFIGSAPNLSLAAPGDEILETSWRSVQEILGMPDEHLVGATYLRRILTDYTSGIMYPLKAIVEITGTK